jgi:hypothetical protein
LDTFKAVDLQHQILRFEIDDRLAVCVEGTVPFVELTRPRGISLPLR